MAREQTWKEYAVRDWGGDHYHIGDGLRRLRYHFGGGGSSSSAAAPAAANVDDSDRAMLDLKVQRDQLVGHRRRMEAQVKRDGEAAKNLVKDGKKQQAMLALRKKKQHEQLVMDSQGHLNRLEELIDNIEFTKLQSEAVKALAEGVKMLKKVQQEMGGVDYVNQLMDERDEALLAQQEISDALSSAGVAADDPEALAEYERLVEAQAADSLGAPNPVPTLATDTLPVAEVEGLASATSDPTSAPEATVQGPVGAKPQRVAEPA